MATASENSQKLRSKFYTFKDYRRLLKFLLEDDYPGKQKISQRQLALRIGIQPTYLSNVFNQRAELNADQLYALLGELQVSEKERSFTMLLLEWERSHHSQRKAALAKELQKIRDEELTSSKAIESEKLPADDEKNIHFFLQPFAQLIHLSLADEGSSNPVQKFSELFQLNPAVTKGLIDELEKHSFIKKEKNYYSAQVKKLHLPDHSPLTMAHRFMMRILSLSQVFRLPPEKYKCFSAAFSCHEDDYLKIHSEFLEFLSKVQKIAIHSKGKQKQYQLNFDLFPWAID